MLVSSPFLFSSDQTQRCPPAFFLYFSCLNECICLARLCPLIRKIFKHEYFFFAHQSFKLDLTIDGELNQVTNKSFMSMTDQHRPKLNVYKSGNRLNWIEI